MLNLNELLETGLSAEIKKGPNTRSPKSPVKIMVAAPRSWLFATLPSSLSFLRFLGVAGSVFSSAKN